MTFLVWEKSPSEEWSWRAAPEGALLGDDLCYENHVTTRQKDDSRGCPGDALGTFWCSQCEQKKKEMVTQREGENPKELEVEIRKLGSKGGARIKKRQQKWNSGQGPDPSGSQHWGETPSASWPCGNSIDFRKGEEGVPG